MDAEQQEDDLNWLPEKPIDISWLPDKPPAQAKSPDLSWLPDKSAPKKEEGFWSSYLGRLANSPPPVVSAPAAYVTPREIGGALQALGTGAIAFPASVATKLGSMTVPMGMQGVTPQTPGEASRIGNEVSSSISSFGQPTSVEAKAGAQVVGAAFQPIEEGKSALAKAVFPNNKQGQALVETLADVGLLVGPKVFHELRGLIKSSGGTIPEEVAPEVNSRDIPEPWQMTKEEFVSKYDRLKGLVEKATDRVEKSKGKATPAQLNELNRTGDWESWSRDRGYTEKEISDYKEWTRIRDAGLGLDSPIDNPSALYDEAVSRKSEASPTPAPEVPPAEQATPGEAPATPAPPLTPGMATPSPIGGGLPPNMEPPSVIKGIPVLKYGKDLQGEVANIRAATEYSPEVKTWANSEAGARVKIAAGITPEQESAMAKAYGPENVEAIKLVSGGAIQKLLDAKDSYAADPSDINKARLTTAYYQAQNSLDPLAAARSNIGRSFGILNKMIGEGGDIVSTNAMKVLNFLRKNGVNDDVLENFNKLDFADPMAVRKFLGDNTKSSFRDKAVYAWLNSQLYGVSVLWKKIKTDMSMLTTGQVISPLQAGIERIVAPLEGREPEISFREGAWKAIGAVRGFNDAVHQGLFNLKNGYSESGMANPWVGQARIKGPAGVVIGAPGRLVGAFTDFVKGLDYHGQRYADSFTKAWMDQKEGRIPKGHDELAFQASKYLVDASKDDLDSAVAAGQRDTMTEMPGGVAQLVKNWKNLPGPAGVAGDILGRFFNIHWNILRWGAKMSPAGLVDTGVKAAKGNLPGSELSRSLAYPIAGTALTAYVVNKVLSGQMTGQGPDLKDVAKRQAWSQTHQPNSYQAGGNWHSYDTLGPLGFVCKLAATATEILMYSKDVDKDKKASYFLGAGIRGMVHAMADHTIVSSMSDLVDAMENPEKTGKQFASSMAGTAVPAIVGQVAQGIDQYKRETPTVGAYVQSRIPGWRQGLNPSLSPSGQPTPSNTNLLRAIIGEPQKPVSQDPVENELGKYGIYVGKPPKVMTKRHGLVQYQPSDQAYYDLTKEERTMAWDKLSEQVSSDAYQGSTDLQKKVRLQRILNKFHAAIRGQALGEGLNR